MGVLNAKVGGEWVPIAPGIASSRLVLDPAYVGPRRDGASWVAQYDSTYFQGRHGLQIVEDGSIGAVVSTGLPFYVTQVAADGLTEDWIASISKNKFQITDMCFGVHPTYNTYMGWWPNSSPNNYILISGGAQETLVNAATGGSVSLRVNNADILRAFAGVVAITGHMTATYVTPNESWNEAQLHGATSATTSRMSLYVPGYAPQWRAHTSIGDKMCCVNNPGNAYANVIAAAYDTGSTATIKRGIRSLRPQRERIVVRHDPFSDVVAEPDIMALRPVAFRPREDPQRITADKRGCEPEPLDSVFGKEGRRERLGLIAEDVEHVIPSAVSHDVDGNCVGIDYAQITVALLDHVQRLTEEIATLRYRVAELEGVPS